MDRPVYETDFPKLALVKRGKVRDLYEVDGNLLLVATDRISAYDVVMTDPIPGKGKILTQISLFWFEQTVPIVKNHIISADVGEFPEVCRPYADTLRGRSMLVRKTRPLTIECVVRGYISGSAWASYKETGSVCGIPLPPGLTESQKLPEPIFTPSTKAELGEHDENIDFETAAAHVGKDIAERVKKFSLQLYEEGCRIAEEKGIIIADTKFEFGLDDGELILIDEVLTPDSSRFWPKADYAPGKSQKSFDKQYLRDYLMSIEWPKTPPAPELPDEVIRNTRQKYLEALHRLTGTVHDI
ncbi:MAG: phosphoribosylaminoimidazolesuccinocarboxamide synthase [Desulfobacterales bacterium]